jgi:hypothetical protein
MSVRSCVLGARTLIAFHGSVHEAMLMVAWTDVSKSGQRSSIAVRRLKGPSPGASCDAQ